MPHYLDYQFADTPGFVSTFDEAPLWSAAFGLLLLRHLPLRAGITVVDIGSGAGFPLMELGARLGASCRLYGIDPWENANERARQKIKNYGLTQVEVITASAEQLPFETETVDLIVSNLGINNFDRPDVVMDECNRVLRPGGRLALTTNLNGHWQVFHDIFEHTLLHFGLTKEAELLKQQQAHRGGVESVTRLLEGHGFSVTQLAEDRLNMNFLDGSAFLNHYFVQLGWLDSWRNIVPEPDRKAVFSQLENQLNLHAQEEGMLRLETPMLYAAGEKRC